MLILALKYYMEMTVEYQHIFMRSLKYCIRKSATFDKNVNEVMHLTGNGNTFYIIESDMANLQLIQYNFMQFVFQVISSGCLRPMVLSPLLLSLSFPSEVYCRLVLFPVCTLYYFFSNA